MQFKLQYTLIEKKKETPYDVRLIKDHENLVHEKISRAERCIEFLMD